MNQTYAEIKALFDDAGVKDFERLPSDTAVRGQFANLFKRFNDYLNAAKIQGFTWKEAAYTFKHDGEEDTLVTMVVDERVYGILALRCKELTSDGASGGDGGIPDVLFDIEPYLTEIDIGLINAGYMNAKFTKYVKCLAQDSVSPEELAAVKEELHKTFAALPQEDQKYAEMLLDDIAHGDIKLETGMTLQDYITQYKTKALSRDIDLAVAAFGLDRALLVDALSHGKVTEKNLNEYERFEKLVKSVDDDKAKSYLEVAIGKSLTMALYRARLSTVLKEFLISGGKDEKIPKIEEPKVMNVDWPNADESYALKAAEDESTDTK